MFGTSVGLGNTSVSDPLGASRAVWVTWVVSATWLSPASRVAETEKAGA